MPDGMEPQARHKKDPDYNKPLRSHSLIPFSRGKAYIPCLPLRDKDTNFFSKKQGRYGLSHHIYIVFRCFFSGQCRGQDPNFP